MNNNNKNNNNNNNITTLLGFDTIEINLVGSVTAEILLTLSFCGVVVVVGWYEKVILGWGWGPLLDKLGSWKCTGAGKLCSGHFYNNIYFVKYAFLKIFYWEREFFCQTDYQNPCAIYYVSDHIRWARKGSLYNWNSAIFIFVTTPTQPQLDLKVGFDTKMTLHHHHHPPQPQTQCDQYLSCSCPYFNQILKVGLWE